VKRSEINAIMRDAGDFTSPLLHFLAHGGLDRPRPTAKNCQWVLIALMAARKLPYSVEAYRKPPLPSPRSSSTS
jgi:hypothetical protein